MNPKLSLVLGILCISFSPIFVKLVPVPLTAAFYRIFIAWVVLAPYCLIKGKTRISRKNLMVAILGGVIFASDIAVWNMSLVRISATVSTLVANLAPVWVGLMSWLIFRKRSGWLFWLGTAVAIFGMAVLVGFGNLVHLQLNLGLILAVVASFFYACYIMVTKKVLQNIDVVTFMFYSMAASSLYLLFINIGQGVPLTGFSGLTWFYLIAMGLICQLAGWLTLNHAINHLDPGRVSISLLSQTVVAGFLAAWLLHEHLAVKEIAGSVIVLAGIAVTFLKKSPDQIKA